jgi:hypothetical protein
MIVMSLLLGLVIALYSEVSHAMDGEYTLHANMAMIDVVEQYLKDHPGHWPNSWDELGKYSSRPLLLAWPKDAEKIKKVIRIDFSANIEDLAKQKSNSFTGIKQLGPHYPADSEISSLLEAIRESLKAAAEKH